MPLPKVIIDRPPLVPPKYGVLDAAVVLDQTDPHTAAGVTWEPDSCDGARTTIAACMTADVGAWIIQVTDADLRAHYIGGSSPDGVCADGPVTVDWGDGDSDVLDLNNLGTSFDHTYAEAGDYTITVSGPPPCNLAGSVDITISDPPADPDPHNETLSLTGMTATKTADDRAGWVESHPVTLYHLSTCNLVGSTERVEYARRGLTAGEDRGLQEAIAHWFSDPSVAPTVLASGAAAHWTVALARLERHAYRYVSGTPVFYMDRAVAALLLADDALEVVGGKLRTRLGSLVIAGADINGNFPGAPDGWDTETDGSWMFVTGTLVVTRQPVQVTDEVISDSRQSEGGTSGAYTNAYHVLAERQVSFGYECLLAAHQVLAVADDNLYPAGA